ncbi:MAG TPA: isoprenyl transferase [Candidatus Nanopelagicales bacterium]
MGLDDLVYGLYERRLANDLAEGEIPRHVGVILDGNRRWASEQGSSSAAGHRAGAAKITEFLGWCDEVGIRVVTLWLLSTDNLGRPEAELDPLLRIIEDAVDTLADAGTWRIHHVGSADRLPERTREVLAAAERRTAQVSGMTVNVAVGYGGRQELVDAVRALLQEQAAAGASLEDLAEQLDVEHIAAHLYTRGQPDPDLVIRTSGEQRLSGFLLWQSAHSEFWFCEAYWPDFRRVDFLRALRDYAARERRYGA